MEARACLGCAEVGHLAKTCGSSASGEKSKGNKETAKIVVSHEPFVSKSYER